MSSWSEEDLKVKIIVPFLVTRDFELTDMEFEKPSSVTVGTKKISIRSDVLVKIRGRPAIIVEVKNRDHKLNDSDAQQAISYARLAESIVPFALVTNFVETKLYDTYSRSEIRSISRISDEIDKHVTIDDELRFEALRNLFRLNYEFLQDFCQSQRKTQMLHLMSVKKGISRFSHSFYVNRVNFEREFEEFLVSKDTCFVLLGEQGTGKTFSMISMAENVGTRMPSLFYDAAYVPGRFAQAIEEDFCWGKKQLTWFGGILPEVDEIMKTHGTRMTIFIDAVNEPMPTDVRKADLLDLIRRLYNTSIKLCLAFRKQDWRFFSLDKGEPGLFSLVTYSPQARAKPELDEPVESGSTTIADFSDIELDLAFPKYKEAFDLKSGISRQAKEVCRHPEMLRLVSEVYAGSALPLNLRRRKVLDKYWTRRLESTGNPEIAEIMLSTVAGLILESGGLEVRDTALLKSIDWNDTYQQAYAQAISGNLLGARRDSNGNRNLRILPNILAEYAIAKIILSKYQGQVQTDVAAFASQIAAKLKGFPLYEGILLLFCGMLDNPPNLILQLLREPKLDAENVLDQVMDEKPETLNYLLSKEDLRGEICRAMLRQATPKVIRIVVKLCEKDDQARNLAVELLLLHETQIHRERFRELLSGIFRLSEVDSGFSQIPDLLKEKLRRKALMSPLDLRATVDFLYRVNSVDPAMAKKLLSKFGIGDLKSIVHSVPDRNEWGRSLYLLSRINAKMILRMDFAKKTIEEYTVRLKNRKVKLHDPLGLFIKERKLSKAIVWRQELHNMLSATAEGLTWLQLTKRTGDEKYRLLAHLEYLLDWGYIYRERVPAKGFIYKASKEKERSEMRPELRLVEDDPHIEEFVKKIVASNFTLNPEEMDNLLEDLMLGSYVSDFDTCRNMSFEIFSASLDLIGRGEYSTIEIPGKIFSFWIDWLRKTGTVRKKVASLVVENVSDTAPKWFKNMILGIRARQHHRRFVPASIGNRSDLELRLKEFTTFFGPTGARAPTEQSVLAECLKTANQLAGPEGPITNPKTIAFINRLKKIFRDNHAISILEMRIRPSNIGTEANWVT